MADLIGRVLDDRYELVAPIGAGATTMVFVAHDQTVDRDVAVKLAHPELAADELFVERFRLRAQHAAELAHPNLVGVLDWGTEDGPYLVVELCHGGSLAGLLAADDRLSPSQALVTGLEAARALEYLHNQGLVHGSLTPSKMLFGSDQRLRISGTAAPNPSGADVDRSGEIYQYWAPEQRNDMPVTDRADVYSLALLLNVAVSGEEPNDEADGTSGAAIHASLGGLRSSLERCGRTEPDDRPDAGELAISLLATAETMPRPQPLPLAGLAYVDPLAGVDLAGADNFELASVPSTSDAPVNADLDGADTPIEPLVGDRPNLAIAGIDVAGARAAAPAPATTSPLDVPVATTPTRSAEPRVAAVEELNGPQPWWPVAVLAAIMVIGIGFGGWLWYQSEKESNNVVPELVGVAFSDLDNYVRDFGWQIRKLENRQDGTLPGQIIDQSPAPGVELAEGSELQITVSLGNQLVEIPSDMIGLSVEQAEGRLGSVGLLLGDISPENSEVLEAGLVIGISEPITQKPTGESVAIRVSTGPQTRVVPDNLVGQTIAVATEALASIRLGVIQEPMFDPLVPVGTVLTVLPQPGSPIEADSNVTLGVSAGPAPVPVPDIAGLSLGESRDLIESVGLVFIDSEGTPGEPAIGTIPPVGDVVDVGTEIIVVLDSDEEDPEEN